MNDIILEMRNITKTFPGVRALHNVNFQVKRGEIHCLVGENGAGKSTLMKILSGLYPYGEYSGDIIFEGEEQRFSSVKDSENLGIAIISQEIAIIPELSIYENIFFGHEIMKGYLIDKHQTIIEAKKILKRVKLDANPTMKVKNLSVGNQQLVEIAKALSKDAKLIILDEPTSSLNEEESRNLLQLLRELKAEGVTLIMISHRLKEVISIADSITVLRDGETIKSMDCRGGDVSVFDIIKYMVGREIENIFPKREKIEPGENRLEIRNWSAYDPKRQRQVLNDVHMVARAGEIVGLAGLMGAGRTELALSVFGNAAGFQMQSGEILLDGEPVSFQNPMDALQSGLAYVTEDRKKLGLVLIQDIKFNTTISALEKIIKGRVINRNEEIILSNQYKEDLDIRATSVRQQVRNLSGGNQQKVSMAKVLFTNPKVLILDEPTRGIDVGAKYEIYSLINRMAAEGISVIVISSELAELIGICDRIYVMGDGRINGVIQKPDFSEEGIMKLATNVKEIVSNE